MMSDLSTHVAVQQEVIKNSMEKLDNVETVLEETRKVDDLRMNVIGDRLEEYRRSAREDHQKLADHNAHKRLNTTKEILDRLDEIEKGLHSRINEQGKKISVLENWRYYMMGVGGVLMLLLARINFPSLFS